MHAQSHVAISADGIPIHYDVHGNGAIALVFVHGWCCDRRYWDPQVEHFAPRYTVVCLDLAGHGASGRDRTQWTVPAFGQDIVAVVEQLGLEQVVLIGHSSGGRSIVEAARRLPTAVIGLVSVDTWANVEQTPTSEQVTARLAPFRTHFVEAMRTFVRSTFVPTSEPTLVEHVMASMSAAPPHIGIGAAEEAWGSNRQLREGLQEVTAPKIAINNASFVTTNMEAAQRYGIEVLLTSGVGHFVMLEEPQTFNRLLDEAVQKCLHARARQ
jgi:pimeloyl-ACP methyl ester carboxylesterase